MAKLTVKAQSTANRIEHVFIQDSTSTTGAGKTGLTNASVTVYYFRPKDTSATSVSLTGTGSLGTYTSGLFKEVDATNMPGLYELHLPNGVFTSVTDVNHAVVMVKGSGIAPVLLEYDLVAYDPLDAARLGLTQIPASGTILTGGTGANQVTTSSGLVTVGTIGNDVITAASIATNAGQEIADAVLSRNVSNVEGTMGEHTLGTIVLATLENAISGTTLTIYRTDGSTTHATKTLTKTAASTADVITGVA